MNQSSRLGTTLIQAGAGSRSASRLAASRADRPVAEGGAGDHVRVNHADPLQYAVLAGASLSVILHVVRQSNQVTIKRWQLDATGHLIETDPPASLPAGEVVILQPYGSLFFAAAPAVEASLRRWAVRRRAVTAGGAGAAGGCQPGTITVSACSRASSPALTSIA